MNKVIAGIAFAAAAFAATAALSGDTESSERHAQIRALWDSGKYASGIQIASPVALERFSISRSIGTFELPEFFTRGVKDDRENPGGVSIHPEPAGR